MYWLTFNALSFLNNGVWVEIPQEAFLAVLKK